MELALSKNTKRQNNKTLILILKMLLAVAMLGVFIAPGLSTILGPLMAVVFLYLFFAFF